MERQICLQCPKCGVYKAVKLDNIDKVRFECRMETCGYKTVKKLRLRGYFNFNIGDKMSSSIIVEIRGAEGGNHSKLIVKDMDIATGGIPVVDIDGKLIGIVTNRDLRFERDNNRKIAEINP